MENCHYWVILVMNPPPWTPPNPHSAFFFCINHLGWYSCTTSSWVWDNHFIFFHFFLAIFLVRWINVILGHLDRFTDPPMGGPSPPLGLACTFMPVGPNWPISIITKLDFHWFDEFQKLMANFAIFTILGSEDPTLGWNWYHRGLPGGHLKVPGPSTNPTTCPNFRHHILFSLGPYLIHLNQLSIKIIEPENQQIWLQIYV